MSFVNDGIFTGGQMTDLPPFPNPSLAGDELMEIVSPGNAANGINYSINTLLLATLIINIGYQNTIITTGATVGDPYIVPVTGTRILLNKAVASASYVELGLSQSQLLPVLIRDLKGDADVNPITVTFTGGQLVDGLSTVVISTPFGGYVFNPLSTGAWYLGGA